MPCAAFASARSPGAVAGAPLLGTMRRHGPQLAPSPRAAHRPRRAPRRGALARSRRAEHSWARPRPGARGRRPRAWPATAPAAAGSRVVIVGAGLAGLAAATSSRKAGVRADGLRGLAAHRRPLLERARSVRRRPGRGARRRAHRHGARDDACAGRGARARRSTTSSRGAARQRTGRVVRRRAVHGRRHRPRLRGGAARDRARRGGRWATTCRHGTGTPRRSGSSTACPPRSGSPQRSGRRVVALRPAAGERLWRGAGRRSGRDQRDHDREPARGIAKDRFSPYEASDQRYHVRGGNDQVVARLARAGRGRDRDGHAAVALARRGDGRYRLVLLRDGAERETSPIA